MEINVFRINVQLDYFCYGSVTAVERCTGVNALFVVVNLTANDN